VEGDSAVSPRWMNSPALAVRAIGLGLRALHDSLPVQKCPYTWSVTERLQAAKAANKAPAEWAEDHRWLTFEDAWELLDSPPPIDKLVVCHGDACAPNTLIGQDGAWSGHVDLGSLGLADRWADLAVATWSLEWNYGPGWAPLLLRSYGVQPDPARMRYYRVLWDVSP
jgi:kanamycin kinase